MADNGHSATDIITYIGVPLAVLGVLPILYNTFATLVNASKIKRTLRHSRLTALLRSDVVNRVIEIELPRYAVTPWDRFQHHGDYWSLARNPSLIPGGTWTTFNWNMHAIGVKTQRVEYVDQLRQPQAEIAFDELVCYLLDLGAVPDPHGWRLLRSTGLWTPVGCALLKSPDGHQNVLALAPLDDSDGSLSLSVCWHPEWTTRNSSDLPPYWVSLPPEGPDEKAALIEVADTNQKASKEPGESKPAPAPSPAKAPEDLPGYTVTTPQDAARTAQITCQISIEGIVTALAQPQTPTKRDVPVPLDIEHIRVSPGRLAGAWFASAATAYGTTSQTMLWNYRIPDDILAFSRRETVPCGVLVLMELVDNSATPEWASKHTEDSGYELEIHVRRRNEQRAAEMAEARLPPQERARAASERMQQENMQRIYDMRDRNRRITERLKRREMEALHSPKWSARLVAEHSLRWLQQRKHVPADLDLRHAAGMLLHRIVRDVAFAGSLCAMLDRWKAWADIGGMKAGDFEVLRKEQAVFAQAALLVALIHDSSSALEGTLAVDLQECMRLWRKVRLG